MTETVIDASTRIDDFIQEHNIPQYVVNRVIREVQRNAERFMYETPQGWVFASAVMQRMLELKG